MTIYIGPLGMLLLAIWLLLWGASAVLGVSVSESLMGWIAVFGGFSLLIGGVVSFSTRSKSES